MAPALAIAASLALEWVITTLTTKPAGDKGTPGGNLRETPLIAAICLPCVLFAIAFVGPHPLDTEGRAIKEAVEWMHTTGDTPDNLYSTHVYFYHFMPLRVPPVTLWTAFAPLDSMPSGALFVWDSHYSDLWGFNYDQFVNNPGIWRRVKEFGDSAVVIFSKR